jgi:murein DD-endopeptidase MepM/ murein hydrolase activator NlpD
VHPVQRRPPAESYANRRRVTRLVIPGRAGEAVLELPPLRLAALGVVAAALIGWSTLSALYLAFRDDLMAGLLRSNAEMQYAYEDRIASLRAHLDRVASRQLVNQDTLDDRIAALTARQAQLETQSAVLAGLAKRAAEFGFSVEGPPIPADATGAIGGPKPLPEGFDIGAAAPAKRASVAPLRLEGLGDPGAARRAVASEVAALSAGIDRVAIAQHDALQRIAAVTHGVQERFNVAIATIGIDADRFVGGGAGGDSGGPLVEIGPGATPFARAAVEIEDALAQSGRLSRALAKLPLERPARRSASISSDFGPRNDPFLNRPAMHTGIDFRGATGDPVRATAAGAVTVAGRMGGYGNLVEIDHGFGIVTRYAHLSAVHVEVGDTVQAGALIGAVGSTGRSTGPHLHYETRIDGEPVDPMRFLRAGRKLGRI